MKVLAYWNYEQGKDGYLCFACVEQDQKYSDYPYLFFYVETPEVVDENLRCARCGDLVGGLAAEQAAYRIADELTDLKERVIRSIKGD